VKIEDCPGPCAEVVRRFDWRSSPLGGTESWPRNLKLVVGMMLRSSAPKLLLWGDELTTFYNDTVMHMLGSVATAGIGAHFPDFRPQVWPHIATFAETARSGGSCGTSDLAFPAAAGLADESYYHLCYTPVPDDEGVARGVLVDVYNATAAKRVERTLRDENSWLNKLFAEAPVFIAYGSGPECRIEFTNHAFDRLLNDRQLVGLTVDEAVPEMERSGLRKLLRDVFESGKPFIGSNMRVEFDRPDGPPSTHYLDFMYQPVRDNDDAIIGILCTGYDVTERHNAQVEAERLRHQVLHASRINAMGTMAMTVAHELNQPLAAAANYLAAAQVLAGDGDGAAAKALRAAEIEILRAGEVIRCIRSVVQSGRAKRTAVSISHAHDRAIMLLRAAGVREIKPCVTLGQGATHVLADEIQLEQIFSNLLRNAAEAMREHGECSVHVSSAAAPGGRVAIAIRDFGGGLPEQSMHRIFDQLGVSTGEGLGLGLALTRTLVEANGGSISACNAADGGAVFTIELDGCG
jgi:two-component system, LuxR family, sensor kinase FixL